jgi:hypothetical protein
MTSADEILAHLDAPAVLADANRRRAGASRPAYPAAVRAMYSRAPRRTDLAGVLAARPAGVAAGPKPHVQVGKTPTRCDLAAAVRPYQLRLNLR